MLAYRPTAIHARSTEGPMRLPRLSLCIALFAAISWAIPADAQVLKAGNGWNTCANGGQNCRSSCYICRACDRVCQFKLVDGDTKCAWSRTWNAPNPLATPLREIYIPRPEKACWIEGCEGCPGYAAEPLYGSTCRANDQDRVAMASTDISPDAAAGFSPPQSERLGRIRNELDSLGPMGGPAPGRASPPTR